MRGGSAGLTTRLLVDGGHLAASARLDDTKGHTIGGRARAVDHLDLRPRVFCPRRDGIGSRVAPTAAGDTRRDAKRSNAIMCYAVL